MSYLSLKDQIDVSFKVGEQIDRYWQMFINANFVVAIALGSTFISKATSGNQAAVSLMGATFTIASILQIIIVLFFYLFIVMNYRALKEAYKGFDSIIADIKAEFKALGNTDNAIPSKQFVKWVETFNYADRLYLLTAIFGYSIASVTTVVFIFAPYTSGLLIP